MIVDSSGLDVEVDASHEFYCVMSLRGELDIEVAPRVREAAIDLLREGHNILIIDLTGVTFIDSIGESVLVLILKRMEAINGTLSLVCGPGNVLTVLDLTGLTSLFEIFSTLDEATAGR